MELSRRLRASRSYGPQWVMVHDVARRLGIDDEQAQQAVAEALAQHRKEPIGGSPEPTRPSPMGSFNVRY
jgi:hypothetical protein